MLLGNFYSISNLTNTDGQITADISFNAAHDIFKGHFPHQPVVPGVCMMHIVKETLEAETQQEARLTKSGNIKFLNMIIPDQNATVQLKIKYSSAENTIDAQAELLGEGKSFFKLRGNYQLS